MLFITEYKKAIIIGGGISGKLTARVLSDFFKEVIIIEQDQKQSEPAPRKGASQGKHLHALLFAGQAGLEELFPGITEKCHQAGAVEINSTRDLAWFHHDVWKRRYDGPYRTTLQSRPQLEWQIEQYIEQIDNASVLYETSVKDYLYTAGKITGVKIQGTDQFVQEIYADLVVDASGARSFTTGWLERIGVSVPKETVKIGLSYFSRMYRLAPNTERDWKIKLLYPNPPHEKIGGTISSIEDNRHIVTLMGYENEIDAKAVSHDAEGFLKLAKRLPRMDIYEELKEAVPLSETSVYRIPEMQWRRYDKVKNLPEGLLLIGDTICRLDPVFGQGMSVAVLEALALQRLLRDSEASNVHETVNAFHRTTAQTIAPVWSMVTTEDFRYPGITGKRPFGLGIQQFYARKVFQRSAHDEKVYDAFVNVMNLVKPVNSLMNPRLVGRVLFHKNNRT